VAPAAIPAIIGPTTGINKEAILAAPPIAAVLPIILPSLKVSNSFRNRLVLSALFLATLLS
jgi:hypothetical protein